MNKFSQREHFLECVTESAEDPTALRRPSYGRQRKRGAGRRGESASRVVAGRKRAALGGRGFQERRQKPQSPARAAGSAVWERSLEVSKAAPTGPSE